jgi:hypothetical protein
VAYDTFLGSSASGTNLFEVMVWLGVYGGVSPLSANGYPFTPIATVTIGGIIFDLAYGLNGSVKVYSFVARGGRATNFSADLVSWLGILWSAQCGDWLVDAESLLQVLASELCGQWLFEQFVLAGRAGGYGGVYGKQCQVDDDWVLYCYQLEEEVYFAARVVLLQDHVECTFSILDAQQAKG